MSFMDRVRELKKERDQAFLHPGGPEKDEAMKRIAEQDPYGLREEDPEE